MRGVRRNRDRGLRSGVLHAKRHARTPIPRGASSARNSKRWRPDGLLSGALWPKVVRFYKKTDEILAASSSDRVACRPGCDFCCRGRKVYITATKAFSLVEHIEALPIQLRSDLRQRISFNASELQRQLPQARRPMQCAFLKEGQCSIYVIRPLSHRIYHSTNV